MPITSDQPRLRESSKKLPDDYAARIRKLRVKLELTQSRLAELLGVSFASVNRWENKQSRPTNLAWQKVLLAEKHGIDALLKGKEFSPPQALPDVTSLLDALSIPHIDFSSDPETVRIVAEGERLAYGHLFNPTFATEISLIDPLPHQRIAVYDHMLKQPRLRFLLADDAGAGKTIMTGLYIREMLSRRLIHRILIVPPAGLVGNWEREMRTLFNLPFRIVSGGDARLANPFAGAESNLVIISIDTLAGEKTFQRLQEPSVQPYDLVVFDEAHKLSASRDPDFRIRKTERYKLAEALAGIQTKETRWQLNWNPTHFLLLTATPHMGKQSAYYHIWKLLEPEILSTEDAFTSFPDEARHRHFIRRTKEEMLRLDGTRLFPTRESDTLSYALTQGAISEQTLYDETTSYIQTYYNRARILNRSAARLAMSIFQRRLASSTYALLRSFERRLERLNAMLGDIQSGRITIEQLTLLQQKLDTKSDELDVLDVYTADEETSENGNEQNEITEARLLRGIVATSLSELETERQKVKKLLSLAQQVYDLGEESKFEKLREALLDPKYKNEKMIIFTEHRDTLMFLVRRLQGLGFTGQIAQIHGGMNYKEREEEVARFRKPLHEGGARYLVATDAAGEGINLQFCWLMLNYDIPWNPARLEQRMGRIHRYKQEHDPVIIMNLVAGKTREGRVLKTLLDKLENIRRELRSDKVFDVIGRVFEGVSIREYMEDAVTEEGAEKVRKKIEGTLTKEQIKAIEEREKRLFGEGGDVSRELPRIRKMLEQETYCRLLPGFIRRFTEKAAPLINIALDGNLEETFALKPLKPAALDPFLSVLEMYPLDKQRYFTVYKQKENNETIYLHPGEPFFDRLRAYICSHFKNDALKGSVFIDTTTDRPYLFHCVLLCVKRQLDPNMQAFQQEELLEYRLVGLKQEDAGQIQECAVEHLLLLKGCPVIPRAALSFASSALHSRDLASAFCIERVARPLAEKQKENLKASLHEREDFIRRGYDYQDAELADHRAQLSEKARAGDGKARTDLAQIKERQNVLYLRRDEALARLHREIDLIIPGEIQFIAHALVVPSTSEEDKKRHDAEIEAIAVKVAWGYEEANGAIVKDVSTPAAARAAGLTEHPGFDLLSKESDGDERAIEVKGRAGIGDVELTENEWAKACNLRNRYYLYVVYDCASPKPCLLRVQDPFGKLLVRNKGSVVIDQNAIFSAAERETNE